ncbi:hypothetical protein DBR42_01295 [Pelomonas sp. HMWF004]|nr:hypothetical protein DBR42_01295 [Pelomonas sp. HMWF004]
MLNLFDPGRRASLYLNSASDNSFQMMDMYYGQADNTIHLKRNPIIGSFIHKCMGFTGDYAGGVSGRDAYQAKFGTDQEGWAAKAPKLVSWDGLTATQAISFVVRWCVRNLGGRIIFEGCGVYYNQVFLESPLRTGDTDLEARDLFAFFKPGSSSATYGLGTVDFYWEGQLATPTHYHFLTSWQWCNDRLNMDGNMITPRDFLRNIQALNGLRADLWNNFAAFNPQWAANDRDQYLAAVLQAAQQEQNWNLPPMETLFRDNPTVSGTNPMHR